MYMTVIYIHISMFICLTYLLLYIVTANLRGWSPFDNKTNPFLSSYYLQLGDLPPKCKNKKAFEEHCLSQLDIALAHCCDIDAKCPLVMKSLNELVGRLSCVIFISSKPAEVLFYGKVVGGRSYRMLFVDWEKV